MGILLPITKSPLSMELYLIYGNTKVRAMNHSDV